MIAERVKEFIEKYNLSQPFLVAFSGGYDSMCLLDILHKLHYDVIAIHLNHNWRGDESLKDAQNCEEFAKGKGIKYYSETLDNRVQKTETSAREARYEFLKKCARKFNSEVVFTAHNFNDNAETVLYRIIKGTGTIGLQGISEKREIYYRPLLSTTRDEIEKYCKDNNLTPNIDSSNADTKYKRNLIRHKILPLMQEINPKVICAINSLSKIAKEENSEDSETNSQKIKIRKLLYDNNIEYDKEKIENIYQFINENKNSKSGKTLSLTTNLWLFVNKNTIEIVTKKNKNLEQIEIKSEGEFVFEDFILSIEKFDNSLKSFPKDEDFMALVEFDNIDFKIRHRKNGDKIQPLGSSGSQKLKKYLNEKKIPQHKKDDIILLTNDNEILWVCGLGISEKIKVKNKPTHLLKLKRR